MTRTGPESDTSGAWYWCLHHARVEQGEAGCQRDESMGPYESREAAEQWREKADARNEKWDKEDREWSGEP